MTTTAVSNRWRRVLRIAALAALAVLAIGMTASAVSARTYRVGMIPWIAYAPLHIAEERGFWRDLGLSVEVVPCANNPRLYQAIASGEVDLAIDMIGSMIGMIEDGVPVRILGETDWSHGGDKIIVKRDLDTVRLKARPLGVYLEKPSVTFFLGRFLRDFNLKLSDVRVEELTMTELADAFITGSFSVILNCDPEAMRAQTDGDGHLAVTSADYDGIIPEGFVARADRLADIPRDDLVRFFRGWVRAVRWMHDPANWKACMDVFNRCTFKADGPYTEPELLDMLRSVRVHPPATQLRRNADPDGLQGYLRSVRAFLRENGLSVREYDIRDILDNGALIEALKIESGDNGT